MAVTIKLKRKYRVRRSFSGGTARSRTGSGGEKRVKKTQGTGPRRRQGLGATGI